LAKVGEAGGYVATVGERLKEERLLRGWSQRDLARESGTTAETISSIETGQHEPRPSTLRKLAEGLGIEVRDFYAEPALPKAEASRGAGPTQVSREEFAVALRELLDNLRNTAQPIMEQDDQTIAGYRQALARMKGGVGVSDAYFVEEESIERVEMAEVLDLVLAKVQRRRREMARGR
jgi:transcriptional regulator with XRE-family HTH domain